MITQTITSIAPAANPATMDRATFSTTAAANVLAISGMTTELNTWAGQVNAIASTAVGDVATAIGAATAAAPVGADEFCWRQAASGLLKKVSFTNALAWFAAVGGNAAQTFAVAAGTGSQAVNKTQADGAYAALAGLSTQVFSVGSATSAAHAAQYAQVPIESLVINSGFVVNQGGYVSGAVLASGAYGHDMWRAGTGGGDYSFTQLNSDTQITIAANKTIIQAIENKRVQGTSYVLSWQGTAQARYAVNSATPAGAYAASPILITGQTAGTTMSIEFGNGASAGTLGKVLLTEGAVVLTRKPRDYDRELIMCMRHYWRQTSTGTTTYLGVGSVQTSSVFNCPIRFPVPMYAAPTLETTGTATDYRVFISNAFTNCTSIPDINGATISNAYVNYNTGATLTPGQSGMANLNGAAVYLGFRAGI